MDILQLDLTVRDLVDGYHEDGDDGGDDSVVGYGGALDIRPPFHREFVYNYQQRDAVIESISMLIADGCMPAS